MKLKELISELKKYESDLGDSEVVTYYSLPMKNPPKKQGSVILLMDKSGEFEVKNISWENVI